MIVRRIFLTDSSLLACRNICAPFSSTGLKNLSFFASSLSQAIPISLLTSPHIFVTITTFFNVLSPQSWRNILKFRVDIPLIRKSEIRCMYITPASVWPCSYLYVVSCLLKHILAVLTYVVARKRAIIRRMSASLLVVSSNPGVSINATIRPPSSNGCATLIISVQDSSPAPTRRSDPLARLINYSYSFKLRICVASANITYGCLSSSSGAHNPTGIQGLNQKDYTINLRNDYRVFGHQVLLNK